MKGRKGRAKTRRQKLNRARIYIEVTDACHLQCRSCTSWTKHGNTFMSLETFEKILNKSVEEGFKKMQFYWRGESYLHPNLPEMMEMAKNRGMQTFCPTSFSTHYLSDEAYVEKLLRNITRFSFNFDGYDAKSLDKYRVGADWDLTLKNLETVNKIAQRVKPRKVIWLKVLMFRYNELHKQFFDALPEQYPCLSGVSYVSPTILGKNVLTRQEADEWLAVNPKYQRYTEIDYKLLPEKWVFRGEIVKRIKDHVWLHKHRPKCSSGVIMISVNGEVGCCSQDTDLKYSLGNILVDSFQTIIDNHAKYASKMYNRKMDICKTRCLCRQNKNVAAIYALKSVQPVK